MEKGGKGQRAMDGNHPNIHGQLNAVTDDVCSGKIAKSCVIIAIVCDINPSILVNNTI